MVANSLFFKIAGAKYATLAEEKKIWENGAKFKFTMRAQISRQCNAYYCNCNIGIKSDGADGLRPPLLEMFIKPKSKQASNRSFFFQALSPISRPAFVPSRDHRLAQGLHHWALRLRHELH